MVARWILLALLVPYVGWLVLDYEYHFLDGVNLAFHEAGHLFFNFGGRALHFLGGTLAQLLMPGLCAVHFLRREQTFEACICGLWGAESAMNVAVYVGDAQARALPLLGGGIHDWHWLLGRAGWLEHCQALAGGLHAVASLGAIAAWLGAAAVLRRSERSD